MQVELAAFTTALICLAVSSAAGVWSALTKPGHAGGLRGTRRAAGLVHWVALTASLIAVTLSLVLRAIQTGHGPFSSMYEFSVAFAWGIMLMALIFSRLYRLRLIGLIGAAGALGLMIFAANLSSRAAPLMPALQQSLLLSTHVGSAVISYGALAIGFGAAIAYLFKSPEQPEAEVLDRLSYHCVIIGFFFLTLVIILGAIWADIAWGRYWNWDPKETASLVTWLLFAAYLHARLTRGWKGKKAAVLLIAGFAAVLFTFLGNYIFNSLHAYN